MAESSTIARPYAEAAFKLADASATLSDWSAMLGALSQVAEDDRVREKLTDPSLSAAQVAGMFISILSGKLNGEAENFVRVLAENRRLELLPEMRTQYEQLRNEREGTVEAEITSAFSLEGTQLADIVAVLEKKTGRKVKAKVSIDKELIGGAKVAIGDKVFDASAKAQLTALANALKA